MVARIADVVVTAMAKAQPTLMVAYSQTVPASNGVAMPDVLNSVYHQTYSRVLSEWLRSDSGLQFAHSDGTFRYTGYGVVR
jgi:hypothetical protein